jgi:nitrogen-specific signal transduction histidine kinase
LAATHAAIDQSFTSQGPATHTDFPPKQGGNPNLPCGFPQPLLDRASGRVDAGPVQEPHRPNPPPDAAFLDNLRSHIALLDEQARIVWVNRAWRRFGRENQATDDSVDRSYEQICDAAEGPGASDAAAMLGALRAIRRDALDGFTRAYDCSSPQEHRVFQAQLTPAVIEGRRMLILSHDNITQAVDSTQTAARLAALSDPGNPAAVAAAIGGMLNHELSAPLTALICMLSGVRHLIATPGADPAALQPILAEAIAHADRARATTAALRTLTAQPTPVPAPADLAAIAGAIAETVGEEARARSVRIETDLAPAPTETDPARATLLLLAMARGAVRDAGRQPIGNRLIRIRTGSHRSAWVSIATPPPAQNHEVIAASCGVDPDPFGPAFIARTAADLGGSLTTLADERRLELPLLRRHAA